MDRKDQGAHRARAAWIALSLIAVLTYACAAWRGGPVDGRAVDANTGEPLKNAVAYGIWEGALINPTRTDENCIWAESSLLDEQGRFHLPFWVKLNLKTFFTPSVVRHLFIYAPGYQLTRVSPTDLPVVKVRPFAGTTDERFRVLMISPCVPSESEHRMAAVYRMIADEMERLAVTPNQYSAARTAREDAIAARTNLSKPTIRSVDGYLVNVNPADQYPE